MHKVRSDELEVGLGRLRIVVALAHLERLAALPDHEWFDNAGGVDWDMVDARPGTLPGARARTRTDWH